MAAGFPGEGEAVLSNSYESPFVCCSPRSSNPGPENDVVEESPIKADDGKGGGKGGVRLFAWDVYVWGPFSKVGRFTW